MITNPITLQTWDKNNHLPAVKIIQGDILSRTLTITLVSSPKQPVDLTDAEVRLYLQQPDGTKDQVAAAISDAAAGQIQATLPPLPPGKVSGTVRVAWQNEGVLYVPPFGITVARNYAYAAYTHIRYAMDASGLGMTDKASLWESSGRNLVPASGNYKADTNTDQWTVKGVVSMTPHDGYARFERITAGTASPRVALTQQIESGIQCTLSMKFKKIVGGRVLVTLYNSSTGATQNIYNNYSVGDNWTVVTSTITITGENKNMIYISHQSVENIGDYIDVEYIKLSVGGQLYNWSPAPEDYPSDYRQPYVGICQTNDPIAPTDPAAYVWQKNKGGNI